MKCYELRVSEQMTGGSSVCVTECGGVQLRYGESLFVKPGYAGPLFVKYKGCFESPVEVERQNLRGVYYDWAKATRPDEVNEPEISIEPGRPLDEEDVQEIIEDLKEDKSMGSKSAAAKRRRK
jgi:hypothetical protein